jgi:hypothetical protein
MRVSIVVGAVSAFCLSSAIGAGSARAQGQAAGDRPAGAAENPRLQINREVIGHALSMAIESSGLMMTAQTGAYSRAYGAAPGAGMRGATGAGGGSYPGGASISGGANSAGTQTRAGGSSTTGAGGTTSAAGGASTTGGSASTGSTQGTAGGLSGAGGTGTNAGSGTGNPAGSGRSTGLAGKEAYTSGNRTPLPPPRRDPIANTPPGQEDYAVVAAAGSPGMIGYAQSQLQQHARRGFDDSERLFREAINHAGGGNSLTSRFLTAAQDYARALESVAGWRSGTRPAGSTTPAAGSAGGLTGNSIDPQTLCLVNHAVKEALDSWKLKSMCRSMDGNAEGTQVLRQHAQEMKTESQRLIDALASSSDVPGTHGQSGGASSGSGAAAAAAASDEARRDPRLLNAATPPAPVRNGTVRTEADPGTETSPATQAAAGIPTRGIVAAQEGAAAGAGDARGSTPVSVTSLIQMARGLIRTIGEVSGE